MASAENDRIECRVGSWFFKRMACLAALLGIGSLVFLYDGSIGYPQQNFNAALFAAFEVGKSEKNAATPIPEDFFLEIFSEKQQLALESALAAGKSGETWSKFAASRNLAATEPEMKTASDLSTQKNYAAFLALAAVMTGVFTAMQKRKTLVCEQDQIILPSGLPIDFESITSINLTKWDRGIALLKTSAGKVHKIDDYKFEGAGKIIDRLRKKRPDLEIVSAP